MESHEKDLMPVAVDELLGDAHFEMTMHGQATIGIDRAVGKDRTATVKKCLDHRTLTHPSRKFTQQPIRNAARPTRNSLCPCGSGKKFKRCHGLVQKPI